MGFGNYKKTVWITVTPEEYDRYLWVEGIVFFITAILIFAFIIAFALTF